MKTTVQILLIFISTFGQKTISGNYSNRFGEKIELKADSTFIYNWNFDLASSWTRGKWSAKNDTIYLNIIPVMDTLKIVKKDMQSDSLVLSADQKENRITKEEALVNSLSGGGQNRKEPPQKLYFEKGRLYRITNENEIDDKKHQQMSTGKKFKSFFYRTD